MRRKMSVSAGCAFALFASLSLAQAAQSQASGSVSVSPYAGYMSFGNILEGPLSTSIHNSAAPVFGAQVNLTLAGPLSVVGNVAYSEPDLRAGVPILGGVDVGRSAIWMYDAGLQLTAPGYGTGDRGIFPFVQAGIGAMKHDVTISGFTRRSTSAAYNAGLGADIPLARNMGLRIVARDYIGKFDVQEATGIDYEPETTHNFAVSAGLRLSF